VYAAIAEAVAQFCIAFLNNWLAREDLKKTERQKLIIDQLTLDDEALAYLADKRGHPDAARLVRLAPGAGTISLGGGPTV
jgi:hypothetical protein